jgi:hypothetical protein
MKTQSSIEDLRLQDIESELEYQALIEDLIKRTIVTLEIVYTIDQDPRYKTTL